MESPHNSNPIYNFNKLKSTLRGASAGWLQGKSSGAEARTSVRNESEQRNDAAASPLKPLSAWI
jgi:hypothetical protein